MKRLTNVEMVILRFIKLKPAYAYELEQLIEDWKLRHWVKIGGPTIYQVLNRLCQQGLLSFEAEKEGNMPARRRYFITETGNERLVASTKEILRDFELYYFDLSIGLACRQFIERDDFLAMIAERREKLGQFIAEFNEIFEASAALYPDRKIAMREYLLAHYQVEMDLLNKIIESGNEKHVNGELIAPDRCPSMQA